MKIIADFSKREDLVIVGEDGTKWFFPAQAERSTRQNILMQRLAESMIAATKAVTDGRDDEQDFVEHTGVQAVRIAQALFVDEHNVSPTLDQAEALVARGVVNFILRFDAEERSEQREGAGVETAEDIVEELDLDDYKSRMLRPTSQSGGTT